ncbi:phosphorylase family protein [Planktothrix mougeotii]|uniref:Phosphorylase n=1 Tax=Planktothrix mougeotii LEGE 06226 TaxID=1828728 RepID=A0ABR9UHP4_9CYAN|nr:phosphorylase [Planktothrix mougeotii]MBE9145986.1 phosphorylase [Planktothrix mougeotii LEGE 06226]
MQPFNFILVPQGQEYQAVMRGLQNIQPSSMQVIPIPIGSQSLTVYLQEWLESDAVKSQSSIQVLVLGLCGSLSPNLHIGDIVIYKNCLPLISPGASQHCCDIDLTLALHQHFIPAHLVCGLTSEQVITTAVEKQKLGQRYSVEVVDMEGTIILELLTKVGIKVAMVRVISDDCYQNLPDLTTVIDANGQLKKLPFLKIMLQHPIQILQLIRSGLKSLQILQQVTQQLGTLTVSLHLLN